MLLLQNPPAVPTLAAAWATRLVRGGAVVVDWHNLGFSVLEHGLKLYPMLMPQKAELECGVGDVLTATSDCGDSDSLCIYKYI